MDLVITSPPYADQRKHTYGGVKPDDYVEWFLPIADELKRVLKPRGSFILNIKERVLHLATECGNKSHSATFPVELPKWFIRLFSQPGDVVLDPFIGSGTTAVACIELDRSYVRIELDTRHIAVACERLNNLESPNLFTVQESGDLYKVG